MSVVLAYWDKETSTGVLGADSALTFGTTRSTNAVKSCSFGGGQFAYGGSGSAPQSVRARKWLQALTVLPTSKEETEDMLDKLQAHFLQNVGSPGAGEVAQSGAGSLVGTPWGIAYLDNEGGVYWSESNSIGCGGDVGYGALLMAVTQKASLEDCMTRAILIACDNSAFCAPPVVLHRFGGVY